MKQRNIMFLELLVMALMIFNCARVAGEGHAIVAIWAFGSAVWGVCVGISFVRWRLEKVKVNA